MAIKADAVVLGVGGIGSSALFHLAKLGLRVVGIEQFGIAHDRGSSHGETRAIRKAYFEHPAYVPLLESAYQNWRSLEELVRQNLLVEQGLIEIGPPNGVLIQGVRRASELHSLQLEEIERQDFEQRFSGFHLPDGHEVLYEPEGGYLLVEQCVEAYCNAARSLGAEIYSDTPVISWRMNRSDIEITTNNQTFLTDRMVITAGAWSTQMLQDLEIPLELRRKHLHWYQVPAGTYSQSKGSPVFFYETDSGYYYGFPSINSGVGHSIKLAEHSFGESTKDPSNVDRRKDTEEAKRVEAFLRRHLPLANSKSVHHKVCMYTMTPDEHFVIDKHPQNDSIVFAAGMSGHGFKFASAIGEILADLATKGTSSSPIDFLELSRFTEAN